MAVASPNKEVSSARVSYAFLIAATETLMVSERSLEVDSFGEDGPEALRKIELSTDGLKALGEEFDGQMLHRSVKLKNRAALMSDMGSTALTEFSEAVSRGDSKTACIQARYARAAIQQQLALHPSLVDLALLRKIVEALGKADDTLCLIVKKVPIDHRANIAMRHEALFCALFALETGGMESPDLFCQKYSDASKDRLGDIMRTKPTLSPELQRFIEVGSATGEPGNGDETAVA